MANEQLLATTNNLTINTQRRQSNTDFWGFLHSNWTSDFWRWWLVSDGGSDSRGLNRTAAVAKARIGRQQWFKSDNDGGWDLKLRWTGSNSWTTNGGDTVLGNTNKKGRQDFFSFFFYKGHLCLGIRLKLNLTLVPCGNKRDWEKVWCISLSISSII